MVSDEEEVVVARRGARSEDVWNLKIRTRWSFEHVAISWYDLFLFYLLDHSF